jgi:hypothetical protein
MGAQYQAANVKPPYDVDSDDNFRVAKFTAGTTHAANAVPHEFCGKYVTLYATGGDVHFGFSPNSSAEIDRAATETAAGETSQVGGVLPNGLMYQRQYRVPSRAPGGEIYFVRESTAASTVVYMELSSG